MTSDQPIIQFTPPQKEVFWAVYRILWLVWRRQLGKSFLFGAKAMDRCMERVNHMACIVSGSILMGSEVIEKEALLWRNLIDAQRLAARAQRLKLTTNADDDNGNTLDPDALADLFEHAKLECRLWHSNTNYSRTRVLSPNPDTARGLSGDVFGDEVGFWPDFRATMDAIEPIISRRPDWINWMATSPPADDSHPTYELLLPQKEVWTPNATGNWYSTNTDDGSEGDPVHRMDAKDGILAGIPMYGRRDGKPVTIEEAMRQSIDKEAFRRNYLLEFIAGGASALGLTHLDEAQKRGGGKGLAVEITDTLTV